MAIITKQWTAKANWWDKCNFEIIHWIGVRLPGEGANEEMTIKEKHSIYYLFLFVLTPVVTGKYFIEDEWE